MYNFTVKLQLQGEWNKNLLALKCRITSFSWKFSNYTVNQGPVQCCWNYFEEQECSFLNCSSYDLYCRFLRVHGLSCEAQGASECRNFESNWRKIPPTPRSSFWKSFHWAHGISEHHLVLTTWGQSDKYHWSGLWSVDCLCCQHRYLEPL